MSWKINAHVTSPNWYLQTIFTLTKYIEITPYRLCHFKWRDIVTEARMKSLMTEEAIMEV